MQIKQKLCRVGKSESDFKQVPLIQFFWKFNNIVEKYQY